MTEHNENISGVDDNSNKSVNTTAEPVATAISANDGNPALTGTSTRLSEATEKILSNIRPYIVGQDETIELLLAAMFTGGHVLLEGLPGIAKTLIAKLIARSVNCRFNRIQFTPDLMPADITGTSVFNMKDSDFVFRKGPIFANIILIDEVNRAPAKTQSALMEVMEEKQMSYDGQTYPMAMPFFVIATQNPIEQEGTYALPEAQLDRFVFRLKMGYPDLESEVKILQAYRDDFLGRSTATLTPVLEPTDISNILHEIEKVHVKDELLRYIATIMDKSRNSPDLYLGASPRASLAILRTSKALAAMRGRNFVIPDDIKDVAIPAMNHRVILSHEREMEGSSPEQIIADLIASIAVPR
jgi:MoxR-like ATPase